MKGNELDDLFRQKLGHRKLTPPAGSWEKIENNLSNNKQKRGAFWLRIAAGMALLFTLGWLIIPVQDDITPATIAEVTDDKSTTSDANEVAEKPTEVAENQTPAEVNATPPQKETITPVEPKEVATPITELSQTLVAENNTVKEEITPLTDMIPLERSALVLVEKITLQHVVATHGLSPAFDNPQILPLDVSLIHNYSEEGNEEIKRKKKFRVLNGIISIAKGVNKNKIGFEGIRNAKNGFINDGLKYGVQETDETEKKGGDDGKNAGDQNKNAGEDLKNAGDLK